MTFNQFLDGLKDCELVDDGRERVPRIYNTTRYDMTTLDGLRGLFTAIADGCRDEAIGLSKAEQVYWCMKADVWDDAAVTLANAMSIKRGMEQAANGQIEPLDLNALADRAVSAYKNGECMEFPA